MKLAPVILLFDRLLRRVSRGRLTLVGLGAPGHPAWTANLSADPNATIVVRGWPGYEVELRLAGREFRIFVLTVQP